MAATLVNSGEFTWAPTITSPFTTAAVGWTPAAGNLFYVGLRLAGSASTSGLSATANFASGVAMTALGSLTADGGAGTSHAQIFRCTVPAANATAPTITFSWTNGTSGSMEVVEVSGGGTDHVAAASGTGTNPIAGSVTGGGAGLLVAFFSTITTAQTYSSALDSSGGSAMTVNQPPSGTYRAALTSLHKSSAGPWAPRITQSTSEGWTAIALFVDDAGGSTPISGSDSATESESASLTITTPAHGGTGLRATAAGHANASSFIVAGIGFRATVGATTAVSGSDSAALADQVAIAAATSTQDSATLAEQIRIALTATDSAQLGEAMRIALSSNDTAQLHELVSLALAIADAATLSESMSVQQNGGNTPSSSDSATLADIVHTTAALSTSDIGALAEQAAIRLGAADLAAMTEQIGLGLIAADSAALVEQLQVAVHAATTDSAALAELQVAVNAALAAADSAHMGEAVTVQVFSGGARDWVYVIFAPSAKWTVAAPTAKWSAGAPQQ